MVAYWRCWTQWVSRKPCTTAYIIGYKQYLLHPSPAQHEHSPGDSLQCWLRCQPRQPHVVLVLSRQPSNGASWFGKKNQWIPRESWHVRTFIVNLIREFQTVLIITKSGLGYNRLNAFFWMSFMNVLEVQRISINSVFQHTGTFHWYFMI